MDCLTVALGLPVLVAVALAGLGVTLEQPAMAWGFGYLALIGAIPFLWFLLGAPIRQRFGAPGERLFQRVLVIGALVELALPLVVAFVASIPLMHTSSTVTFLVVFAFWWRWRTR